MSPMTKKKPSERPESKPASDRHKSHKMVRLPNEIHDAIKEFSQETERTLTREIIRAIIEYLTKNNRWPRQPKPKNP